MLPSLELSSTQSIPGHLLSQSRSTAQTAERQLLGGCSPEQGEAAEGDCVLHQRRAKKQLTEP